MFNILLQYFFNKNSQLHNLFFILIIISVLLTKAEQSTETATPSAITLSTNSLLTNFNENFSREFDSLDVEDYPEPLESAKPDNVDNEIIDKIVEHFLNKGTLDGMKQEKTNKEAAKLVNSSTYWRDDNLAPERSITEKKQARKWLNGFLVELKKILHRVAVDGWSYFTAASPITKENLEEVEEVARDFLKSSVKQAKQFDIEKAFDGKSNELLKRQMDLIVKEGMNALNDNDLQKYNNILYNINQLYTTTSLCDVTANKNTPCIYKFADLQSVYQSSNNVNQTLKWWISWRLAVGANLTDAYTQLVDVSNKAAQLNGYKNIGKMWQSAYDSKEFNLMDEIEMCYEQILPFYQQLHSYFRPRLAAIYGGLDAKLTRDGAIPSHLLKSLNGENWIGHYEQTKPFADETIAMTMTTASVVQTTHSANEASTGMDQSVMNMDEELSFKEVSEQVLSSFHFQNYTVKTMFSKAYRYMKYLGFDRLPSSFWSTSIFSRNWSKDMICNPATAYDMIDDEAQDYRIKVCSQLSEQEFINAHKLFAQLYYKYLSRNETILLRDAPNPSLSTAISSAFGILATNPDYLKGLRLIDPTTEYSEPYIINHLYREALEQFVALPYFLVSDKWRFAIFEGKLNETNSSDEWWKLRFDYQGVKAPTSQSVENLMKEKKGNKVERARDLKHALSSINFDAVAAPIISQQHAPAARNFVSYILQFQVLKFLCPDAASLNQGCIPKKNKIAKIVETMKKGSTISWIDAMEQMTGSKRLDAGPLLEYYESLISWLKNSNQHENVVVGWINGNNTPFAENDIPELKQTSSDNEKSFLPGDEQIAYPGQSCSNGQECLLDSECDGEVCKCREGLFTLQIADTYNCVQSNPAQAGFTDEHGGLVIALNPNNNTNTATMNEINMNVNETQPHNKHHHDDHSNHIHQEKPANFAVSMSLSLSSIMSLICVAYKSILIAQNFVIFK